jgi:hypothetical protein
LAGSRSEKRSRSESRRRLLDFLLVEARQGAGRLSLAYRNSHSSFSRCLQRSPLFEYC